MKAAGIVLAILLNVLLGSAQTNPPPGPVEEKVRDESDPTQSVFLSVRNEYFNLNDEAWTNSLIIRSDRVFLRKRRRLGGKLGILTRFDVPMVTTGVGGTTHAGLGDLYGQALYIPWLTPGFAVAVGSGLTFPTATHRSLGGGKWRVAPVVAPIWFFPKRKGFFFVKLQQFVSFAGDPDRPDSNHLLATPTLVYRVRPRWWILLDTEIKTDWERDNHLSFRTGFQVGHVVTPRLAIAVKPEVPWGGHREGDWALKTILTWYRRRD